MAYFNPGNRTRTPRNRRIYAAYEIGYTAVDTVAALSFLTGSFLFLSESTKSVGIWLFVVGSFFFAMKPTLRFVREMHYAAIGRTEHLAKRAGW